MSGPGGNESEVTQLEETPHSRTANRTEKKLKQRPNPLFVNPLSALSPDICARFPTELHDYIIDHLHNDKHTLIACSLVCHTWGASSRYHLFRNASTIRVHRGNFQQFCELLDSQRLNAYIGRLHLQSHLIDDEFSEEPTFQFNYHLHHFIGLPSLKYLRLDYHHDSLLPEFFAALARNFASVTDLEFTSMHFDSFAQFVQIVDSLPLLRRIALDRVVWYDSISDSEDDDTPADHISPPTYRPGELTDVVADCLILNSGSPLLTWLASQPCIRRLAISIGRVHREAHTALFSDVLRTLGPRLEHLIIYDADNTYRKSLSLFCYFPHPIRSARPLILHRAPDVRDHRHQMSANQHFRRPRMGPRSPLAVEFICLTAYRALRRSPRACGFGSPRLAAHRPTLRGVEFSTACRVLAFRS